MIAEYHLRESIAESFARCGYRALTIAQILADLDYRFACENLDFHREQVVEMIESMVALDQLRTDSATDASHRLSLTIRANVRPTQTVYSTMPKAITDHGMTRFGTQGPADATPIQPRPIAGFEHYRITGEQS